MNHNIETQHANKIKEQKIYIEKLEKEIQILKENRNTKKKYEFKIGGNIGLIIIICLIVIIYKIN